MWRKIQIGKKISIVFFYVLQLAELDEMFKRNPRAIKDIMRQLNPGEEFYLDLAGNVRKGPSSRNRNCYCAPVFSKFEKRLDKDKRDLIRHIDQSQSKLDLKIAYLEKNTKKQLFGLNQSMKEAFAAERGECQDRMERRALRERIAIERQQVSNFTNFLKNFVKSHMRILERAYTFFMFIH